jgi:predicted NBD/HSP70 family sugar kinase
VYPNFVQRFDSSSSLTARVFTTTPKPGWNDTVGSVRRGLGHPTDFPVAFDTDANAPAMAENAQAKAAGSSLSSCAYVTAGTGVGALL